MLRLEESEFGVDSWANFGATSPDLAVAEDGNNVEA